MGNRCPDCNKFVGLEAGDPEAEDPETDDREVTVSVRVVLNCADCGSEMAEWQAELVADLPQEVTEHALKHLVEETEYSLAAEWETDPEVSDSYRSRKAPTIDKKTGLPRPVPFRFQTHYYSVGGQVLVSCSCQTGTLASVELFDELEASGFDSTV